MEGSVVQVGLSLTLEECAGEENTLVKVMTGSWKISAGIAPLENLNLVKLARPWHNTAQNIIGKIPCSGEVFR